MANTILIIGATGKQGGAVIDALCSASDISDISILAVTRNPESRGAKALTAKSDRIKLVKGDLDDCDSIFRAAGVPIKAVFGVSMPVMGPWAKPHAEEVQGKALVDVALAHGVEHFVFTSVERHGSDSDTNPTDVPHFASKFNIEKHLKEKSVDKMTWTILRPVAFMDAITPGFAGKILPTAWKYGLSPTIKLQLIACADIGWFGAQALLRPKDFAGRAISLAGDDLTFEEANAVFKEKVGEDLPTTWGFLIRFVLWAVNDVRLMFQFFEKVGYAADIGGLRREHPGLQSFGDFLNTSVFVAKMK